ncbi:MAG TPA: ABC-F family ATP-binding cassette domain-containing protein [Chloroflexota bacterium]|nr:ABC-F family ATP-binding cassette domain-containing protein [Chloroflexota bacterium]
MGKSTLLRLLAGETPPDSGQVVFPRAIDVAYLPQEARFRPGQSIDSLIREAQGRVAEVGARLEAAEQALARGARDEAPALLEEYAALAEQFERLGGYDLEHRINAVLSGLGVAHLAREREMGSLSGGEKARVGLAAVLLRGPDLLLLDEPTNHLDFQALRWLEDFLLDAREGRGAGGGEAERRAGRGGTGGGAVAQRGGQRAGRAIVVVSHDRAFLDRTATSIVEIDEHLRDAREYPGRYSAFLAAKQRERAQWEEAYAREQAEIKALREAVRETARRVGHPNRPPPDKDKYSKQFFAEQVQRSVSRNVRAAQEKLRRIEANPMLRPPEPLRLRTEFDSTPPTGRAPLLARGLVRRYGGRAVLRGVDLALEPGSRTLISGPNGVGKSTLLRLLAGQERPDEGTVSLAPSVVVGYLEQEPGTWADDPADPAKTLFEAYRRGLLGLEGALRADLVRHGFFRHQDLDRRVRDLSAGQRRKLQLARLVATGANLLLLDEPTNHLDFPTLEAFEEALQGFPGPVLAVSHDRRFIERFGGQAWELAEGHLVPLEAPDGHPV